MEEAAEVPVTRVAVIGVGSAGLASLKQVVDAFARPEARARTRLHVVGYETRDNVGGLWNFDADPKPFVQAHVTRGDGGQSRIARYPQAGENPTPFYENLRATLPADLMAFREHTFGADVPVIPWGDQLCAYLHAYADRFKLRPLIRFRTRVERLYKRDGVWVVESSGPDGRRIDAFDYVSVNNGHYTDPYIPHVDGLESFAGDVIHSREYRSARAYLGRKILVVGSGNSGSDIVRQVASQNLDHYLPDGSRRDGAQQDVPPFSTVYHSVTGANRNGYNTADDPWSPYIRTRGVITRIDGRRVHFADGADMVDDVDTIIFATGYSNSLPFCKVDDAPWAGQRVLKDTITADERVGGDTWESGGMRGLHMTGLDELLLFLAHDRSIAFIGLQYQIVPFPFSEVQARLAALLWAGLLPSFPSHPRLPPRADAAPAPPKPAGVAAQGLTEAARAELIFKNPYEWTYTRYLFDLMREADSGPEIPAYWKETEQWRIDRRHDTGLRKRMLGY